MLKKTALLVAALALMASSAFAAPHFGVGLHGGLGLPLGDFADETNGLDAKSGFTLGLCIDYHVNDMFSVGVEGSWMSNKHGIEGTTEDLSPPAGDFVTYDKAKFTTTPVLLTGRYNFPMADSKFHPYVKLGLGMYMLKYKEEVHGVIGGTSFTDTFEPDSETKFGGKLGLGGEWMTSEMLGVSIDADYNFVTMEEATTGVSSLTFATITAGLHWHFAAAK